MENTSPDSGNQWDSDLIREFLALKEITSVLEVSVIEFDDSIRSQLLCGLDEEVTYLEMAKADSELKLTDGGALDFRQNGEAMRLQWVEAQSSFIDK